MVATTVTDAYNGWGWEPSISLKHSYGTPNGLCMDIGFRATLSCGLIRLRTCKEHGLDTQFVYDEINNQIRSTFFEGDTCNQITGTGGSLTDGGCLTINGNIEVGMMNLKLDTCVTNNPNQAFYVEDEHIKVVGNTNLCVAEVGGLLTASNGNHAAELGLVECNDPSINVESLKFTIAGAMMCPVAGDSCTTNSDCKPTKCGGLHCNNNGFCRPPRNLRGDEETFPKA